MIAGSKIVRARGTNYTPHGNHDNAGCIPLNSRAKLGAFIHVKSKLLDNIQLQLNAFTYIDKLQVGGSTHIHLNGMWYHILQISSRPNYNGTIAKALLTKTFIAIYHISVTW